jgi:TPR repeat protein
MEIYQMGVPEWAQAWLAFKELYKSRSVSFDHCSSAGEEAIKAGWFDNVGLFGSVRKTIAKNILSSPHRFSQAYGWFNADIWHDGNTVMPQELVEILATKRHTAPALLFGEPEVATAIGHMCCDIGSDALRQGDSSTAAKWLSLAADQGSGNAQLSLGHLYSEGKGVPQDRVLAHKWFNLAAARLSGDARDKAVTLRDKASKGLTADQRAEAEVLARQWKQQSWDEIKAVDSSVDACW